MHLLRPKQGGSFLLLALAALSIAACGDDTPAEPSTPATITAAGGTAINGRAGTPATVSVTVATSNGKPLPNTPVTFAVATGGGTVVPPSTTTDANGQATAAWSFGTTLGAQTLTVTAGSITQTITATVTAGLPAQVTISAGSNQTAAVGAAVGTAPAVLVRDAAGNPISGVQVQFVALNGGTVVPSTVQTDASGIAKVTSWTLGTQTGLQTLQATVLGQTASNITGNPTVITATATAGAASRASAAPGFPTTAVVGTALSGNALPGVVVTDLNGNPVQGTSVTFAVTGGGGTISGATATTDAQGVARAGGFTLGTAAGTNTITATISGLTPVTLAVTGTAAAAAQTQIVSGNNQSVPAGQALQSGPRVRVLDRFGNPVQGATVTFLITRGNGSLIGSTQTTGPDGTATLGGWVLGTTPGTNTVVARVAGAPDVTFNATGQAGAPAKLEMVSGDSTSVIAFRTATTPFVVRVVDAGGFPVQGAAVNFAVVNAAKGSVTPTTATTDSLGRASANFVAKSVTGVDTVTASIGNLTPVSFVITITPNVAAQVVAASPLTQPATVNGLVAFPPAVKVLDAQGNPVRGVSVFWGITAGTGATRGNQTSVTDSTGTATVGSWTVGPNPGAYTLVALTSVPSSVPGSTLTFTANAVAAPQNATISVEPNVTPATAPAGSVVPVAVRIKDGNGAGVAGLTVQFQVTQGGGNVAGQVTAIAVTDANGVARINNWTLGTGSGTVNSITALVSGTGLVTAVSVTNQ